MPYNAQEEILRHQEAWRGFLKVLWFSLGGAVAILVILALTLL